LRELRRVAEHVAEGQENNRGLLRGVLEEVMGPQKIFTISQLGDRPDQLLVKGSLPLS
jgi:hypothetical protein